MVRIIKHLMTLVFSDFDSLAHSLPSVIQMHHSNVSKMPCSHGNSFLRLTFMSVRMNLHSIFRCLCKIASCLSIRLSAHMEQLGSQWTYFREIWYLGDFFLKSVKKIQDSLKLDKNKGHFTWRPMYIFIISRSFLRMGNVFGQMLYRKIETHILCSVTFFFFPNMCCLWNKVEKYCRVGQATDDNMAHAHCMLGT